MKATSTYKMSGMLKRSLALSSYQDPHKKGEWKRAMIQAELVQSQKYNPKRDKNAPDLE